MKVTARCNIHQGLLCCRFPTCLSIFHGRTLVLWKSLYYINSKFSRCKNQRHSLPSEGPPGSDEPQSARDLDQRDALGRRAPGHPRRHLEARASEAYLALPDRQTDPIRRRNPVEDHRPYLPITLRLLCRFLRIDQELPVAHAEAIFNDHQYLEGLCYLARVLLPYGLSHAH